MNNLELYATYMIWKDFYFPLSFLVYTELGKLLIDYHKWKRGEKCQ